MNLNITKIQSFLHLFKMVADMPNSKGAFVIKNIIDKGIIMVSSIKANQKNVDIAALLEKCDKKGLASIFLRYKPIFLALKQTNGCAPKINELRRLANKYHKPLSEHSLQNVLNAKDWERFTSIIDKASNRDLIKVINSIYTSDMILANKVPSVYTIRNGKVFVKSNEGAKARNHDSKKAYIYQVLFNRLHPVLNDKKYYIPDYISYTVPTTEKQFIGNIPYGTKVTIPDSSFTAGIHWFNQSGDGRGDDFWPNRSDNRVDIDIHLNGVDESYGWNSAYKNEASEIIYTGDHTDAPEPDGAAEAYWFKPSGKTFVLTANLYAGPNDSKFKFFVTAIKPKKDEVGRHSWASTRNEQDRRYTFRSDEALFPAIPLEFNKGFRQMTIGVFHEGGFYLQGGSISNNIVPKKDYKGFIDGLTAQLEAKITLRDLFTFLGVEVYGCKEMESLRKASESETEVSEKAVSVLNDIVSLAPEDLEVDTLLNILDV